jgi:hypothetical protein
MMKTSVRQDSIGFTVMTPSRSIRAAIRNLTPPPPLQVERGSAPTIATRISSNQIERIEETNGH